MYVDYGYYWVDYGGKMPEEAFQVTERKAEAYIRYLTRLNGDIFSLPNDMVKDAVCAAADVYYAAEQEREQRAEGKAGLVQSENNDGYSVSYVVEQTDGQTAEEVVRRKAYNAVYMYLLPTGWLRRKVGCGHAHECRHNNL
uniref:hypothetical protein n=1 Tax=Enterocloster clostridioformis TaxID=1531 RepID=UPI0026F26AB1|nr:hypothetical protein [Enterocloster clostridioformis]